jgi:hypothetical protein
MSIETLRTTRGSLHAVAEHVLAASQYARKRRLGLRQATGGFATQPYVVDGVERRVTVVGTELLVRDDVGGEAAERRVPITSLRAAGGLAGGPLGMSSDAYRPSPMPDPDGDLAVDPGAASIFANFLARVQAALTVFAAELVADGPSEIQLWPEHFDLAATISEVNYGGSPETPSMTGPTCTSDRSSRHHAAGSGTSRSGRAAIGMRLMSWKVRCGSSARDCGMETRPLTTLRGARGDAG